MFVYIYVLLNLYIFILFKVQLFTMSKKSKNLSGFYLVPVESYKTLAELKTKNEELEKQLSDSLKFKALAATEKVAHLESQIKKLEAQLEHFKKTSSKEKEKNGGVSSEHFEPTAAATDAIPDAKQQLQQQQQQGGAQLQHQQSQQQQGGSDIADIGDDNKFRQKMFTAFETFLRTHKLVQSGSGNLDLTPIVPIPMVEASEIKPSPENVTDLDVLNLQPKPKDANVTELNPSEDKLLESVRNRYKDKAKRLLSELKKHSTAISVLSDGGLIIHGQKLPNANFYTLFPLLYRPVKNHRENSALSSLADVIASLGLGHLILRNYTAGITPKGKNYLKNRGQISEQLKNHQPWYYLGSNE